MKLIAALTLGALIAGCDQAYAFGYDYGNDYADTQITLIAGHGPLTAENGMTLYTFDKDSTNTSNCYDSCADSWPPYLASAGETMDGLTAISRNDGTMQWAKDGAPLYFWIGDTAPGDTNGDGVGGVWHIAQ